jgi:uncharacterized protein with von Willebrand factor type A (vWA) domain
MNGYDPQALILQIFLGMRVNGFALGIGELLAALRALDGTWGLKGVDGREELHDVLRLLWCHSRDDRFSLDMIWDTVVSTSSLAEEDIVPEETDTLQQQVPNAAIDSTSIQTEDDVAQRRMSFEDNFELFPVRAPVDHNLLYEPPDLQTYWPASRHSMAHTWRYLRRMESHGPSDVLDIPATSNKMGRQYFFLEPVYQRRQRNVAHLILFLDQGGSMVPFHRYLRDLEETALLHSNLQNLDVYYFHNVIVNDCFDDPHLTRTLPFGQVLSKALGDTSILVASDAGAARGYRSMTRIRATAAFLRKLQQRTNLIAWLNPVPRERWEGSSAGMISSFVPMFQLDTEGLSNAIDVVRGGSLHYSR